MTLAVYFEIASVFFAGLLAGMELALHYGVRGPTGVLDDRSLLLLRQALVVRLRVFVPALFLPTTVCAIVGLLLDTAAPGEWLRLAGVLALILWIVIRVVGTVPINSATLTWRVGKPPPDWKARVRHAERFHDVGVWAVVFAFACFLVGVAITSGAP
jgi:hypothetical protein